MRIAGTQKVCVQRMNQFALNGATCRHECLRRYLATKSSETVFVGMVASEDVDFNGLEIEQVN
jgi:hypothetical protein